MEKNNALTYCYPEAKSVVVSGDIHGDFNELVYKLCIQYQMTDTLLVVAGDCGFGFEKKAYYEQMYRKNAKRLNEANNWIVFVRGNHDNPAYFDGTTFKHKRMRCVPDYTVLQVCNHNILCVGGAISIDRKIRMEAWNKKKAKYGFDSNLSDGIPRAYYWSDESPVYDEKKMDAIRFAYSIDIVITHTAPSCCELQTKSGLTRWAVDDPALLMDVQTERFTMDQLLQRLQADKHPITHWYYGHFHQSWHVVMDGILYRMLDIMEFCMVY